MKIFGFEIKRVYEATDKGRRGKAFRLVRNTGANTEVASALQDLRSRSRHMVRNNGWAKRAVESVVKLTIGTGIKPAPLGTLNINKQVKSIWRQWAETTACDFYGLTNFAGLQENIMRSVVEGGDAICILRRTVPKNADELPLKLQLLEGDFIDHTRNGLNDKGVARLGVQYNNDGELLGYWLFSAHPGDVGLLAKDFKESEFYPKEQVLMVFEQLRLGQCRGVPFGVSAFTKLSDYNDYEDAQLLKQKVASCFAAFIGGSTMPTQQEDILERLEPGVIQRLGSEETITFADPPSVGDYDNYSVRMLQGIAVAYGITYELLSGDYRRVNFTSGRMAMLNVANNFKSWQYNMMVPMFCNPVWEAFIDACLISGKLTERISADWTSAKIMLIDPVKETNARLTAVKAGFQTVSEILREDGRDRDEFFEEYKEDQEMAKTLGIIINSIPTLELEFEDKMNDYETDNQEDRQTIQ